MIERTPGATSHTMFIETERTPNPQTLKFLPGCMLLSGDPAEFASPEDAERSPLAVALFALGDVTRVLIGQDFVAVTAEGDWAVFKPEVLGVLSDHLASGAPILIEAEEDSLADDPADAEIVTQIRELIDTRVRPAVAGDGGDIVYRGFHEGVVSLRMKGACSGCPSSTATLKHGIESLLKYYVPEVTEVRAV